MQFHQYNLYKMNRHHHILRSYLKLQFHPIHQNNLEHNHSKHLNHMFRNYLQLHRHNNHLNNLQFLHDQYYLKQKL